MTRHNESCSSISTVKHQFTKRLLEIKKGLTPQRLSAKTQTQTSESFMDRSQYKPPKSKEKKDFVLTPANRLNFLSHLPVHRILR